MSETSVVTESFKGVQDELAKDQNRFAVPKLERIIVNVGLGSRKDDKAYKEMVLGSLALITGQKASVRAARKSIAGFKLREGQEIGASVTLRGRRMQDFFYRLVHVAMPRIRDFRGVSPRGFDGHGNFSVGIKEHTVFPEIAFEDVSQAHPLGITMVTTADDDDEAFDLLKRLGFPFAEGRPKQRGGKQRKDKK
ncbi:MAG: 50S ribosomal protein L5 [bacterium]|nr:50S ribosomal protein L5 [bacterium]MDZ4247857.1 50S ribosomal protein L5 [Patescibacteria group bacterium]